jgi:hypothetical protein
MQDLEHFITPCNYWMNMSFENFCLTVWELDGVRLLANNKLKNAQTQKCRYEKTQEQRNTKTQVTQERIKTQNARTH